MFRDVHFRESHVEINTHFLIPARIHKQLGLHILCKVKVELGCKEREHQHTSYDRHGSTRKRFDSKILQRFWVSLLFRRYGMESCMSAIIHNMQAPPGFPRRPTRCHKQCWLPAVVFLYILKNIIKMERCLRSSLRTHRISSIEQTLLSNRNRPFFGW